MEGNLEDTGTHGDTEPKGPRWALFLAWLGILVAVSGVIDMVLAYQTHTATDVLLLPRNVNASDYLIPGVIFIFGGAALAVFGMVRRVRG